MPFLSVKQISMKLLLVLHHQIRMFQFMKKWPTLKVP